MLFDKIFHTVFFRNRGFSAFSLIVQYKKLLTISSIQSLHESGLFPVFCMARLQGTCWGNFRYGLFLKKKRRSFGQCFNWYFSTNFSISFFLKAINNRVSGSISEQLFQTSTQILSFFEYEIWRCYGQVFVRYFSQECSDAVDGVLGNFSVQKISWRVFHYSLSLGAKFCQCFGRHLCMVLLDEKFSTVFFEKEVLALFWACFLDRYFLTSFSIKILIDNDF